MMNAFPKSVVAALLFALTEGSVGPGCNAQGTWSKGARRTAKVTTNTLRIAVKAGLLTAYRPEGISADSAVWYKGWKALTPNGLKIAHAIFFADRSYTWDTAGRDYTVGEVCDHPVQMVSAFKAPRAQLAKKLIDSYKPQAREAAGSPLIAATLKATDEAAMRLGFEAGVRAVFEALENESPLILADLDTYRKALTCRHCGAQLPPVAHCSVCRCTA